MARMSSIISIMPIALLFLSGTDTTMFTLSCEGTMTNLVWHSDNKPEPVTKMELVVNFPEHTVTGFAFPAPHLQDRRHSCGVQGPKR
jgi:hypothetical protein